MISLLLSQSTFAPGRKSVRARNRRRQWHRGKHGALQRPPGRVRQRCLMWMSNARQAVLQHRVVALVLRASVCHASRLEQGHSGVLTISSPLHC
jgi:hypothetical protein